MGQQRQKFLFIKYGEGMTESRIRSYIFGIILLSMIFLSCNFLSSPPVAEQAENLPGGFNYNPEVPLDVNDAFTRASDFLNNQEYERAEVIYREIIEKYAENPDAYVGLGSALFYQDKLDDARDAYMQAFEISEDSIPALIGLGSVELTSANYEKAIEYYDQALQLDDELPEAHWGIAISYSKSGQVEAAIDHLETYLLLAPNGQFSDYARELLEELK